MTETGPDEVAASKRALLAEVIVAGVPWWLAIEAVASTALDRDHDGHTQSVQNAREGGES